MKKNPKILIIGGKGSFGQIFHILFKKNGAHVQSIGRSEKEAQAKLVSEVDIVIISVPIEITEQVLKEVIPFLRKDSLLADFTSLKVFSTSIMKSAPCGILGIHPLFGPLVENLAKEKVILCPIRENAYSKFIEKAFKKEGLSVMKMSPEEHDERMSYVQALTHIMSISFLETATEKYLIEDLLKTDTPVFRMQSLIAGRILSGKPDLYANIQSHNPYFKKTLSHLIKNLQKHQKAVAAKNTHSIENKIEKLKEKLGTFAQKASQKSREIL